MALLDLSTSVRESRLYELNKWFAHLMLQLKQFLSKLLRTLLKGVVLGPSAHFWAMKGYRFLSTSICLSLQQRWFVLTCLLVMATFASEALSCQFPGANCISRSALIVIGPNHQHHADGHNKPNAQALNMGSVSLPIYRIKDQWALLMLHFVVVPNNQLATTIGHVHLDEVEKHECEPILLLSAFRWHLNTLNLYSDPSDLCDRQRQWDRVHLCEPDWSVVSFCLIILCMKSKILAREVYTPELNTEKFPPML